MYEGYKVFDKYGVRVGVAQGLTDGKLVVKTGFWIFGSVHHVPSGKFSPGREGTDSVWLHMPKKQLEVGAYIARK